MVFMNKQNNRTKLSSLGVSVKYEILGDDDYKTGNGILSYGYYYLHPEYFSSIVKSQVYSNIYGQLKADCEEINET